ncbi:hypothetical protein [Methylomarinum vadi]|uniref:hypothetical protein n=1 Tax=Methylomarinum vadi TaxID=438855 RepID=UPI001363A2D9|nr:hypothetical protein [Methylomarinum vadi]
MAQENNLSVLKPVCKALDGSAENDAGHFMVAAMSLFCSIMRAAFALRLSKFIKPDKKA